MRELWIKSCLTGRTTSILFEDSHILLLSVLSARERNILFLIEHKNIFSNQSTAFSLLSAFESINQIDY